MNKEEIVKQAKKIIDNFYGALASIEKEIGEVKVERDECQREENEGTSGDNEFREIMFRNAPKTKGECIKAERGKWV